MGEFNKRHLDLITYSSICHAKTVLDLYTGNINKNQNHIYSILLSEIIKNKAKTNLKVSLLVKTCHLHYSIKSCENILMSSDY